MVLMSGQDACAVFCGTFVRISIRWFGWPPIRVCICQNGRWALLIGVDIKSLLPTRKLQWVPSIKSVVHMYAASRRLR